MATASAHRSSRAEGGEHILVVDDDELIVALVRTALEREGYRVTTAADGRAALGVLDADLPSLVVSDVNMPGLDGFSLLARVRSDPRTRWVPVLLLTTRRGVGDIVEGLALGADDYLTKPFAVPELLARLRAKLDRPPVPVDLLPVDRQTGLASRGRFDEELARELGRAGRGGRSGTVGVLGLSELESIGRHLGRAGADATLRQIAVGLQAVLRPLDVVARLDTGHVGVLMPETPPGEAEARLRAACSQVAALTIELDGEHLRVTPSAGYASFADGGDPETLLARATVALDYATAHLDLLPLRWEARMDAEVVAQRAAAAALRNGPGRARAWWRRRLLAPAQIAASLVVGLVLPFLAYWGLDRAGLDVTWLMYLVVVISLAATGALILVEGLLALRTEDPPDEPATPYPPATAIIAAYLPNEAATILETVEAFRRLDYPAPLQIILAYNTPQPMPVEVALRRLEKEIPGFEAYRVENSTSKAQNVNAALGRATGAFVGVFDADHHPDPGSFRRAWRWLSHGDDVVQGHCLVRNGTATRLARMVAVEFEAIYAVAHPGRARLHNFGIFGGSNGYWRTDLLHEIRMRGSMLTEDIDSSLRVLESGGRVRSDPGLISRELATTTLRQVWNQRIRWAQGWFQVSVRHLRQGLRSKHLTWRQKLGLVHLLGWRELYPWLSLQMFPIVAYWIWRGDALNWRVPIFVITTVFTLSVGPVQTYFAYRRADPEIRRHRRWFVGYLLFASFFYTEYKNIIARVAQIKELTGERNWRVTPRSAPAPTAAPAAAPSLAEAHQ